MQNTFQARFVKGVVALATVILLGFTPALAAASPSKNAPPVDQGQYDQWLSNQVRHQLVMLPWLSVFDNLEYRVDGTTVTLTGQVVRPTLKDEAGRVVKNIEGVKSVDNQIQVLPLSGFDNRIRFQEFRTIYGTSSLSRYELGVIPQIHIIVDNGHVTLVGYVDTQGDKDIAGLRANTVPGVFSVTNDLIVAAGK